MRIEFNIKRVFVFPLLWLTKFYNDNTAVLVCKGYGDDWDYFTGLYWDEDKDIDYDDYEDFRLWLKI